MSTTTPPLPASVDVLEGTDVAGVWKRFEIFEALHHSMQICNPMTSENLDAVVEGLAPRDGDQVVDIACGYGELLVRVARQADIAGIGVDLSPWMLVGADRYANDQVPDANLRWVLGDGKHFDFEPTDIVASLGATWIWHGFEGTARAIAARTRPGGRIAIGDMRLRDGVDHTQVAKEHGRVLSIAEHENAITECGVRIIDRIDTADESWDAYIERTRRGATSWRELHPGPRADEFVEAQLQWEDDHARDMPILTWSVWIGEQL